MLDFTCYETHHRIPLVPLVEFLISKAPSNDYSRPSEMYFAEKYILNLTVSASFYANNANFKQAKQAAEKRATEYLFKDVARKLHNIQAHAYKHNDHDLLVAIDQALAVCRGEA